MKFWLILAFVLAGLNGSARADNVPSPGDERFDWGVGGYVGIYYDGSPGQLVTELGQVHLEPIYLAALTATGTLWHFDSVPLTIEFEGVIAKRFGAESFFEFAALPMLRWRYFPWNDIVYTTLRFGPLGVSYTTGISQFEQPGEGPDQHLANFLVFEITAASPRDKSLEGFVRLHHRSDIFGLAGDIPGNGDDFLALGLRQRF